MAKRKCIWCSGRGLTETRELVDENGSGKYRSRKILVTCDLCKGTGRSDDD